MIAPRETARGHAAVPSSRVGRRVAIGSSNSRVLRVHARSMLFRRLSFCSCAALLAPGVRRSLVCARCLSLRFEVTHRGIRGVAPPADGASRSRCWRRRHAKKPAIAAITTATMMAMTMAAFISGNVPLVVMTSPSPDDSVVTRTSSRLSGAGSATWSALITLRPNREGARPSSWPQTKSKAAGLRRDSPSSCHRSGSRLSATTRQDSFPSARRPARRTPSRRGRAEPGGALHHRLLR